MYVNSDDDDSPTEDMSMAAGEAELRAAPNFAEGSVRGPQEPLVYESTDTLDGADAPLVADSIPVMLRPP